MAEIVSRLFVYGTLRAGQAGHAILAPHARSSAPATTRGRLLALDAGYPGLVRDTDGHVVGELVELADAPAALAVLDAYEGDEYDRVIVDAVLDDGARARAWCYVLRIPDGAPTARLIESGDWLAHVAGR